MLDKTLYEYPDVLGEKWYACVKCGAAYKMAEVWFDSGSTAPTADETFTGATSGDTGVVVDYQLYSGTFAGGDAAGVVTLKTLTGSSTDSDTLVETIFQDDENLNGSTAGDNCMTVKGTPQVMKYGRLYPESQTAIFRGKRYCSAHYRWHVNHILMDEAKITIDDGDRGSVW